MAKLNTITDEQMADLKAKSPGAPLRRLKYEQADVAIRPAPPVVYQRFLDEVSDKDLRSNASRALVFGCVVSPDEKGLASLLDQWPAMISVIADDCVVFSGAKAATEKKDF